MNTTALKRFATTARVKIQEGVELKLIELGFDREGNIAEDLYPQQIQGATLFRNRCYPEEMYVQWNKLYSRIQSQGFREVCEEVAYTWFNRMVAIQILQKNGLIAPVLTFVEGYTRVPQIVLEAQHGRFPNMSLEEQMRLQSAMQDDNRKTEAFTILLVAFCHSTLILNNCFGQVADYTELLLPNDILADGGFVDMLNHTDYISDEDYHTTELLGWLYQFYISERKDEVFASFKSGKKATAEDIPAATQIFTPNWIVKYMVQNTIGRIYLDNEPYSDLKDQMPYLVDIEPVEKERQFRYADLEELTMIDPACGSGHILLEGFELFLKMYQEAGYTISQAIKLIFTKNLSGIELDSRAKQLSTFALMLKACQKDRSFMDAHVMPRVLDMPQVDVYTWREQGHHMACAYGLRVTEIVNAELEAAFSLLKEADNLGSIMKFSIGEETHEFMIEALEKFDNNTQKYVSFSELMHGFRLILALTNKYAAVVANPPYMGSGNMNADLSKYVKENYPEGKADLFAVFMILSSVMLKENGKYGMINMQSWMFLSSFENLRKGLLDNYHIDSMLHLGPRTFDELGGEVVQNTAFVISNCLTSTDGAYFRLVDGKNCGDKERMFLARTNVYPYIPQENFAKIPGCPIGYWVSPKMAAAFGASKIGDLFPVKKGADTADNNRFLRLWHEVVFSTIGYCQSSSAKFTTNNFEWAPYNKGGDQRKWFGNNSVLVLWKNNGYEIEHSNGNLRSKQLYFKDCITWNALATKIATARLSDYGAIFDSAGSSMFPKDEDRLYVLGLMNSKCIQTILQILNPTLNYGAGTVANIPIMFSDERETISGYVSQCVDVSKKDWNFHETSWDFQQNELVWMASHANNLTTPNEQASIVDLVDTFHEHWVSLFYELHVNEEELNRLFIDIYGLQDELSPDVPLDEITILQQGEISIEDNVLVWHDDVLIKQLISYAVGVTMGRYRLDQPGLHIAHPNPTKEELASYIYQGHMVEIDDDAIIPILPDDSPFADNLSLRIKDFVRIVFGDDILTDNLNYIEQALGKSINEYLQRDFYADHKRMYQNRPIYWLFSSKKGAFRCLVYMHRMDAYTAEKVRSKYLLPYMDSLRQKIDHLRENEDMTGAQRREQTNLQKAYDECQEYHERLHKVAGDQIAFDLDDGVVVNYAKFGDVLAKRK